MSARHKKDQVTIAPKGTYLRFDNAVNLMHRKESRLVQMNTPTGKKFFILPRGGAVKDADAKAIMARPDIVGMKDALFPGLDQTFRMVR
jgi:hypothetical protein